MLMEESNITYNTEESNIMRNQISCTMYHAHMRLQPKDHSQDHACSRSCLGPNGQGMQILHLCFTQVVHRCQQKLHRAWSIELIDGQSPARASGAQKPAGVWVQVRLGGIWEATRCRPWLRCGPWLECPFVTRTKSWTGRYPWVQQRWP